MNKVGPNEPCWCGSGTKYKKCHMSADRAGGGTSADSSKPAPKKQNPLLLDESERNQMRKACAFNAKLMDEVRDFVKPGIKTIEIDKFVHEYTVSHGHTPATLGYGASSGTHPPFPASLCTSVNDVICHGIPNEYELKDGDIINCDLTSIVDGWHGDQSETFFIGEVSDDARAVTQASFDSMWLAIDAIKPCSKVIEIGRAIVKHARATGFSVVQEYQGHGIGRVFHQKPHIPHFPDRFHGSAVLEPGICFTIEPMLNVGKAKSKLDRKDGWTVYTIDGELSAQFEHTILMTEQGPEIMTQTKNGPRKGHKF
ncbi:methionyl aminopeptidase [Planctomycetota bacterium]|nr:methionyl aminopeptidase [Planctomycetota bacterium]